MSLSIKGQVFGAGEPVVCVPVVEEKADDIVRAISAIGQKGMPMVEWRADYFENLDDPAAVADVLERVRGDLSQTVLLFTVRTDTEGGLFDGNVDDYAEVIGSAAATGLADLIDVEFLAIGDRVAALKIASGCRVIVSHHDFGGTEDEDILYGQLCDMQETGADMVKLAVMPKDRVDVIKLLSATTRFSSRFYDTPVITMSMGNLGLLSRLAGELTGSAVTFASIGKASAPGQISYKNCRGIVEIIHEGMKAEGQEA